MLLRGRRQPSGTAPGRWPSWGSSSIIEGLVAAKKDSASKEARTLLGLGTDLGGYAIMIGGTNGAHLTSFSLVDVLSHGRACALMNPYYTVFFAPAIEDQLRVVGRIYREARVHGRGPGVAVREGARAGRGRGDDPRSGSSSISRRA